MIMLSYHTWTLWFYVDWMNEVLIKEKKRKDDNQAMSVSVRSNRPPVHQRESRFWHFSRFLHNWGVCPHLFVEQCFCYLWRDMTLAYLCLHLVPDILSWVELSTSGRNFVWMFINQRFWWCVSDFWWWHKLICSNLVSPAGWCFSHVVRRSIFVYR